MPHPDDARKLGKSIRQELDNLALWRVAELPMAKRTMTVAAPAVKTAAPAASDERVKALAALAREAKKCMRCPLYETATQAVFGDGNPYARLVFVGEAPGRDEDRQGLPFVGAAGQLLNKMIAAIQMTREDVYICNVVKHRPPQNRVPEPEEVEACKPYLVNQLEILQPAVICTLGSVAAKALLGPHVAITKMRGQVQDYQGIQVVPTFHPAYLLRNPPAKKLVWQDLKLVKALLQQQR